MLLSLSINKILLIDKCAIEPSESFNIISGETGAGKSIILDCLSYSLGQKISNLTVRQGEDKGSVTAVFDISNNKNVKLVLEENDIEIDSDLIIRRTISDSGRSSCFLNDSQVSNQILKNIGLHLLEMYGQHDSSNLLNSSEHINLIDEYAGLEKELGVISALYKSYRDVERELSEINEKAEKSASEEDYLRFVANEIETLNILEGEETELVEKRNILKNSQKITGSISSVLESFNNNSLISNLYSSQKTLTKLSAELEGDLSEKISVISDSVDKASIELEEASSQLDSILKDIGYGGGNIDEIEDRLFAIRELARKYRKNPEELNDYLEEVQGKLGLIDGFDEKLKELQDKKSEIEEEYKKQARMISAKRSESAKKLEKRISKELPALNMQGCRFEVKIENDESNSNLFSAKGFDKIVFTASTNLGQPFTEISKTASGGELSRMMLALKLALSEKIGATTVIFDEVDTGIGGATAEAVGLRLKELSQTTQLICITHQPQVASKCDKHFKVMKTTEGGSLPTTQLKELNEQQSNEEIARMLSGADITEEARAAAKRLKVSYIKEVFND